MTQVTMRYDESEFDVRYDPALTGPEALLGRVREEGFEAVAGGLEGSRPVSPLTDAEREGLDIQIVTHGEAFDPADHVVPGKVVLFDYYADWCGPCRLLTPKLEQRVRDDPDGLALRQVDIVDWESAAAKQATADFQLPGLPHVRVFGPDGELVGEVNGNDVAAIDALIEEARE